MKTSVGMVLLVICILLLLVLFAACAPYKPWEIVASGVSYYCDGYVEKGSTLILTGCIGYLDTVTIVNATNVRITYRPKSNT